VSATVEESTSVDPTVLGELIAATLQAAPGLRVEPVAAGEAVPSPGPAAVSVRAELGGGARLVLLLAKGLARRLQVGPPPAEDLAAALAPTFATAAEAFGLPAPDHHVDDDATCEVGAGETATTARLLDEGGDHVATVVLVEPAATEAPDGGDVAPHEFAPVPEPGTAALGATGLELLHDVTLGVTAELGRARMLVREVLSLAPGSVIELDRAAGSPVDVLVNGTLIARGEVVVIDEEFGIRITEVLGYAEGGR
jgi:flagellar motor switch protein FliN/FliY